MNSANYIQGPYRGNRSSSWRRFTQEALFAFGGLGAVVYLVYTRLV